MVAERIKSASIAGGETEVFEETEAGPEAEAEADGFGSVI
jgi:hypothetical protein